MFRGVLASVKSGPYQERRHDGDMADTGEAPGSTMANILMNKLDAMFEVVARTPRAERVTRDVFRKLDVAGYNYALGCYRRDSRNHPGRVILGTETLPGDVARGWDLVRTMPGGYRGLRLDRLGITWASRAWVCGCGPAIRTAGEALSLSDRRPGDFRHHRPLRRLAAPRPGGIGHAVRSGFRGASPRWVRPARGAGSHGASPTRSRAGLGANVPDGELRSRSISLMTRWN